MEELRSSWPLLLKTSQTSRADKLLRNSKRVHSIPRAPEYQQKKSVYVYIAGWR